MVTNLKKLKALSNEALEESWTEYYNANVKKEEFQEHFGTDFDYNTFCQEFRNRGYVWGWYNPQELNAKMNELGTIIEQKNAEIASLKKKKSGNITVPMSKDTVRMNLAMTKDIKERYEAFLKNKGFNYIQTTAALKYYMYAIENGTLEVSIKI